MATRSAKRRSDKQIPEDESDLEFLASQYSNGSDDQVLEMVVAKHYAALRQKKKRQNQQKFLKAAYKQLSQEVSKPAEELKTTTKVLEKIYTEFLQNYAANEDNIHKLWSQIQKEQQKLLTLAEKKHSLTAKAGEKLHAGHTTGLARIKASCCDLQGIINQIIPEA